MCKKIKVIYDVAPIKAGTERESNRTGIYFCAYNILKVMLEREDVEIAFYSRMTERYSCDKAIQEIFNITNVRWVDESRILTAFSRLWTLIDKKRILHKQKGNKYRNYFLRVCELIIEGIAEIYETVIRSKNNINGFDFYFSPERQAPKYILMNSRVTKIIVLHDTIAFIYPEYFPEINKHRQKHWVKELMKSMNNKELFFANSQSTKSDFLKFKGDINPHRIKVIYHACSEQFIPCHDEKRLLVIKHKYHIPENMKYVLSLCTIEPRKNLIRIVGTFIEFIRKNQINDLILVLGGGAWDSFVKEFENAVGKIDGFSEVVYRAGYIDDEDLPLLYSNAFFFVYTSQYEGFGVPPLEAMKCGCPIIASDSSSIPEVVGDAGLLIEWNSNEQHIKAYEKYYFDNAFRTLKSQQGLMRAQMFSWQKTVQIMIDEMKKEWLM